MKKLCQVMKVKSTFDRVGHISLERFGSSIRLRFQVDGQRHSLTIPGGLTSASVKAAYAQAFAISSDISFYRFDCTLKKYDPRIEKRSQIQEQRTQPTIKDLWEEYKQARLYTAAQGTQNGVWKAVDRALERLPEKALLLENIQTLGQEYLKLYSATTTRRQFTSLEAAIRPYTPDIKLKNQLPREVRREIEWFPPPEVRAILEFFQQEKPHYYPFVAFLAHTGVRTGEAIALEWSDLEIYSGKESTSDETLNRREVARIAKSYTLGVLSQHTKNYKERTVPLSDSLCSLLNSLKKERQDLIVFPSPQGGYLNASSFSGHVWKPALNRLVEDGKIAKYLRPYCLRHSFVTNLHYEQSVPMGTIAKLIGDRLDTVIKYYTGIKGLEFMPEMY